MRLRGRLRTRRRIRLLAILVPVALAVPMTSGETLAAPIVVHCPQQSLATAIQNATTGSTIKVDGTCTGQFAIAKDLTVSGAPHATLDGNGGGSTITITGFHVIRLDHLTITGGAASDGGGIVSRGGGSIALNHVTVSGNTATGGADPGIARGGGIFTKDPAFLTITNSTITSNHVSLTHASVQTALGGGIAAAGRLTIQNSSVTKNTAVATSTDTLGLGEGGGVTVDGTLTVTGSTISDNRAAGHGPGGGDASGGGIFWNAKPDDSITVVTSTLAGNRATSTSAGGAVSRGGAIAVVALDTNPIVVTRCTLDKNVATATSSGSSAQGTGGGLYVSTSGKSRLFTVSRSRFTNGTAEADGATDAVAEGGGIWLTGGGTISKSRVTGNTATGTSGTGFTAVDGGGLSAATNAHLTVTGSTFEANLATGTSTSNQAVVDGGGIALGGNISTATIDLSTIDANRVVSHADHSTSQATGGGIAFTSQGTGTDVVVNSTVAGNTVRAESTSGAFADGAGLYAADRSLKLQFATIARNSVSHTGAAATDTGGGLNVENGVKVHAEASVITLNHAASAPDCAGPVTSDGYNLLGTHSGCSMALASTDQVNAQPKLGPLASNGGPTRTIALLSGSPALNRIPVAPCHAVAKADQRGVARPQGPKCDEGAFEKKS